MSDTVTARPDADEDLLRWLTGAMAAGILFGVGLAIFHAGPLGAVLALTVAVWSTIASISAAAARDHRAFITGPAACMAGLPLAGLVGLALGVGSPWDLAVACGISAVNAMAVGNHPAVRGRLVPRGSRPWEAMAIRHGGAVHATVIAAADPTARRLLRIARSRLTPGTPALCGLWGEQVGEGVCSTCSDELVARGNGTATVNGQRLEWTERFAGLAGVVSALDEYRPSSTTTVAT